MGTSEIFSPTRATPLTPEWMSAPRRTAERGPSQSRRVLASAIRADVAANGDGAFLGASDAYFVADVLDGGRRGGRR